MRNTLPLLSRSPAPTSARAQSPIPPSDTPAHSVPTIRLISATPSAAGSAGDASTSFASSSFVSVLPSSPLAPKPESNLPKKRLVPKKSKLSILGSAKPKVKVNNDFSDVVRRVGGAPSTGRSAFEIYVDHGDDRDISEIVVVKKKKSRLALDGMRWGALGEVTNIPAAPKEPKHSKPAPSDSLLKVKGDDSQKWWSIGRGRKDSKGKDKEQKPPAQSKTPEPSMQSETRARFNSLDSGILLNSPTSQPQKEGSVSSIKSLLEIPVITTLPIEDQTSVNGLLTTDGPPTGSIALRAIRSMRSLARMASWAQISNDKEGVNAPVPTETMDEKMTKTADKIADEKKKKKKKGKDKSKGMECKEKEKKNNTIRYSGSSFEAGMPSPAAPRTHDGTRTLTRKKQSVLGLGLPSTMRLSTVRGASSSTTDSSTSVLQPQQRLSVDSAHPIMNAQGRPSSILSSGSSLRPPSTASGVSTSSGRSARSSSSSVASVRWDEAGLKSVKERQRQERRSRREREANNKDGSKTRKSSESRRRTPISEVFPTAQMPAQQRDSLVSVSPPVSALNQPLVKVEEATADGHSAPTDDEVKGTPNSINLNETSHKRVRPRPMSEQMLGRPRPQAICDNSDGDAVLSLLDAATNDLASLINRLDLEATPASTNSTPLRLSPLRNLQESPLKSRGFQRGSLLQGELRESTASIASLRPYANSQSSAVPSTLASKSSQTLGKSKAVDLIGQQIAPWNELDWNVSPRKPLVKPKAAAAPFMHKRTLTPVPADSQPVFQPLRPANIKLRASLIASEPSSRSATPPVPTETKPPSSRTFGSRPSKVGVKSPKCSREAEASPTPVFSRANGHTRKGSSLVPMNSKGSMGSLRRMGIITAEARKGLGTCGTLGASTEPDIDPEDPDSDIPDELQVILSGQSDDDVTPPLTPYDDTLSFKPLPSPGAPSKIVLPSPKANAHEEEQMPVFQAQLFDADANRAEIDDGDHSPSSPCDDDTKKSFDFTGELRKLNESGGSDRASFVEQLETAFKTPGRIELGFDFDIDDGLLVPPLPALSHHLHSEPATDVPQSFSHFGDTISVYGSSEEAGNRDSGISQVEEQDVSLMMRELEDQCRVYPQRSRNSSMQSKPSDGQLKKDFKFGGKPASQDSAIFTDSDLKPLTLSDIIPPLSHARSLSHGSVVEEDSSVLKSIMAKAGDILPKQSEVHRRVDSNGSSTGMINFSAHPDETASIQGHSRNQSAASFTGFDSFDEVRRGFEFGPDRPTFYPPADAVFRSAHGRDISVFSIASVSSYGAVLNSGVPDPFGYTRDGPTRPPSTDDMSASMSMSVDDTFSFIRHNRPRRRVDSDASSFYFQTSHSMHPYRRGHRRGPSALSVASNAPPVSLYNRSFGTHMRNDSNTSASSVALSYAMHGASGGRAAWARHNRDYSADSIMSNNPDQSMMARPGLGDKMFDNAHGAPLSAISASPESVYSEANEVNRTSWDSIMDNDRYISAVDDSIFDKTGKRTSVSSESVFGSDPSYAQYNRFAPRQQFRPLSIMSEMSVHSPVEEDDTMITMLGGGHVRRRSVGSLVDASPCVRVERNKHTALPGRVLEFTAESPAKESPKARLVPQPSIASTSSFQFGDERMIKARQGLLERQSLEESALIAQGEDLLASLREHSSFSRPSPAARSRSSTCSTSSGVDTPPLSNSDGSSISGGSQSSIDIGHLSALLANTTHPSSGVARARARARARGAGHRRRIDEARMSRSSVYETIQEEASVMSSSPAQSPQKQSSSVVNNSVFIVDSDRDSICSEWEGEHGITTLRRYYALRNEAQVTVDESKRLWMDTPFSLFAVQSFQPPREPMEMQAMLKHSQNNYGPLPSELHPHRARSRTSSRASPYPLRSIRSIASPEKRGSPVQVFTEAPSKPFAVATRETVLREVQRSANINVPTPPPALGEIKPFSPFAVELDPSKQIKTAMGLAARPRASPSTRRAALGWSKRSTGQSSTQDAKENSTIIPTPSETLRISRPRPRGRPTPARVPVPAA